MAITQCDGWRDSGETGGGGGGGVGAGAKGGRKEGGKDGAQKEAMDFISGQREGMAVWMEEEGPQEVKVLKCDEER